MVQQQKRLLGQPCPLTAYPIDQTFSTAIQALKDLHPFQCLCEPDDVAYAVVYLASDESRRVNAADLVVDGQRVAKPTLCFSC